jgi:tetratricopeptide (TPR) repeat protein
VDEWFEIALEYEEAERPEEAARAYRKALLEGGPSSEVAFNLGNVLHSLGRWEEALSRFQQAVEVDPDFAEAWNNLASVHAQFEEWDDAVEAGRRALELAPDFADAHYNLAEAFHASGCAQEARHHARAYLAIDPKSPWAERLKQNLALA